MRMFGTSQFNRRMPGGSPLRESIIRKRIPLSRLVKTIVSHAQQGAVRYLPSHGMCLPTWGTDRWLVSSTDLAVPGIA
jgi:hypothetical protein